MTLSNGLIAGLDKRGIRNVVVAEKDRRRLTAFNAQGKARKTLPGRTSVQVPFQTEGSQELDQESADRGTGESVASDDPFSGHVRKRGVASYTRENMDGMIEHYDQSVDHGGSLLSRLNDGEAVAAEALQELTRESLQRAAEDLDLFARMGINPRETNEISADSMNTATLAVAIGATLGLAAQTLTDLGTGRLVHDAGMLQLDENVFKSNEYLNAGDFVEVAKHPVVAADTLYRNRRRVPPGVRMIVYQRHERGDGSGDPRGRTAESPHPSAKIAAVADVYAAVVSKRPHRPALLPYFAMTKMPEDVKAGLLPGGSGNGEKAGVLSRIKSLSRVRSAPSRSDFPDLEPVRASSVPANTATDSVTLRRPLGSPRKSEWPCG